MPEDKLKVVCIGGGSGLSQLAKGLKELDNIELKCIVTVADDGGNSGVLKEELNIPAVGDIRNVLVALANVPESLDKMMNHRFTSGSLKGHCLGNLAIASLIQTSDNMVEAIASLSDIFNVFGTIIPSTTEVVDIKATYLDKTEVIGESKISEISKPIINIDYVTDVSATKESVQAIMDADLVVYSIGSLYTSVIANLIIPEIKDALKKTKARKIYFANIMSQPGETDNYTLSEYVSAINSHLGFNGIDLVITNKYEYSKDILSRYQEKGAYPLKLDYNNIDTEIKYLEYDIAVTKDNKLIHDPKKIKKLFSGDAKCLFQEM